MTAEEPAHFTFAGLSLNSFSKCPDAIAAWSQSSCLPFPFHSLPLLSENFADLGFAHCSTAETLLSTEAIFPADPRQ